MCVLKRAFYPLVWHQGSVSHTWTGYRFSQFSDWVSIFHGGTGTITIKDHDTGATLLSAEIPLTPGPATASWTNRCHQLSLSLAQSLD